MAPEFLDHNHLHFSLCRQRIFLASVLQLAAMEGLVMEKYYAKLSEANAARQKEWDVESKISGSYRGNEMAGEVGEACNVIKKLEREALGIKGSRATVEQLGEELGDVVICAYLTAQYYGIDLDRCVAEKFNKTSESVGLETRMIIPEKTQ